MGIETEGGGMSEDSCGNWIDTSGSCTCTTSCDDVAYVPGRDGDMDGDGIPDYADGYSLMGGCNGDDSSTTDGVDPGLVLTSITGVNLPAGAVIHITYDASDPMDVTRSGSGTDDDPYVYSLPATGSQRLWITNSSSRDGRPVDQGGDYLPPGDYTLQSAGSMWTWVGGRQINLAYLYLEDVGSPSSTENANQSESMSGGNSENAQAAPSTPAPISAQVGENPALKDITQAYPASWNAKGCWKSTFDDMEYVDFAFHLDFVPSQHSLTISLTRQLWVAKAPDESDQDYQNRIQKVNNELPRIEQAFAETFDLSQWKLVSQNPQCRSWPCISVKFVAHLLPAQPGVAGSIEVSQETGRSNAGRWYAGPDMKINARTAVHELGHLLGLADEYADAKVPLRNLPPRHEWSLMGDTNSFVMVRHIRQILFDEADVNRYIAGKDYGLRGTEVANFIGALPYSDKDYDRILGLIRSRRG